jgi:hypothetical protein
MGLKPKVSFYSEATVTNEIIEMEQFFVKDTFLRMFDELQYSE